MIQNHIDSIFRIKALSIESAEKLLELLDSVTKHISVKKVKRTHRTLGFVINLYNRNKVRHRIRKRMGEKESHPDKPKLSDLTKCLRARASLLQTLSTREVKETSKSRTKRVNIEKTKAFHVRKMTCAFGKEEHHIQACEAFLKLDAQHRAEKVRSLRLCINCLRPGHVAKNCSFGSCKMCSAKHNTLLHFERDKAIVHKDNAKEEMVTTAAMCSTDFKDSRRESSIVLSTALINMETRK